MTCAEVKRFLKQTVKEKRYLDALQAERDYNAAVVKELRNAANISEREQDILISAEEEMSRRERDIVSQINKMIAVRKQAISMIDLVTDKDNKAVLCERFLLGNSWQKVADSTHWSIAQVYIMSNRGIHEIAEKWIKK